MRPRLSIAKFSAGIVAALCMAVAGWLWIWPPELIRVGSNYAAKIVCSNTFLAGRDPQEVLALDVQAPGHPLLKLMQVRVNKEDGSVRAGLFGVFGGGHAVFHPQTGCVVAPSGQARFLENAGPAEHFSNAELAPNDEFTEPSRIEALSPILDDPVLTGPGMRAVVIAKEGRIVGERYGPGFNPDTPLLGWSMTKTVNAAIAGTVVAAGKISVDEGNLLPVWAHDDRHRITLAQLLGMESGLAFNENYGGVTDVTRMLYLEADMAAFAADQPLAHVAGEHFSYSSGSSVIASRLWQKAIGNESEAREWPYRRLFAPLGMTSALFEMDAQGTFVGSSYLYASSRDWVRFGILLLEDGVWQGKRILPDGWVEWMRAPTAASGGEYGHGVWLHGPRVAGSYGPDPDAGFDIPEDAYWLIGHDGQSMTIIPSRRLVILRMGLTPTALGYKPQAMVEAVVRTLDGENASRSGK